jgi:hypothetical protein
VTGGGYAHEFYSNHFSTGIDSATAFQTERHRTILVGGECAATGKDGTGIRFHNPGNSPLFGGIVVEPGIEHTKNPVVIDGNSPFENVQVYGSLLDVGTGEGAAIRFGNAKNCKLLYPPLRTCAVAHWTKDAQNCGVVTDAGTLSGCTYTDEGAVNPYVSVQGAADRVLLRSLPTGVPMAVEHHPEIGGPVFHNGEKWQTPTMQDFSIDD